MSQPPDNAGDASPLSPDVGERIALVNAWLGRRLPPEQLAWIDEQRRRITDGTTASALAIAIGWAPRQLGRNVLLALDEDEQTRATSVVPGFDATRLRIDEAARILFVLACFNGDEIAFAARLEAMARSAEIGEHIALLRGLPLFPAGPKLVSIAAEGIRSAVQPVFEAVAHNTPYPITHFNEPMWNQMVVKALFIGSRLAPIQGLDERRNADLAHMLVDYAHERWAARRGVSPELWRCVGPFAAEHGYLTDLVKVLKSCGGDERKAAALALAECPAPEALLALDTAPDLWHDIRNDKLTWEQIG